MLATRRDYFFPSFWKSIGHSVDLWANIGLISEVLQPWNLTLAVYLNSPVHFLSSPFYYISYFPCD